MPVGTTAYIIPVIQSLLAVPVIEPTSVAVTPPIVPPVNELFEVARLIIQTTTTRFVAAAPMALLVKVYVDTESVRSIALSVNATD